MTAPPVSEGVGNGAASREAAKSIGLRYATDAAPGYRRVGRGKRVRYLDADGGPLTDAGELERIAKLAIPPAWTEVWINPDPRGHILAVGRDARGRKQYRYHPDWRGRRDADKYERMLRFGRRLPHIRAALERDLARRGHPREKVLALVVRLLEMTHMRVGGEEYARLNRSYGLATLRDSQAKVEGSQVRFRFRGKGGKVHVVGLRDRRMAGLVRRIQELPGQRLFEYEDDDGTRRDIDSADVNEYLRSISGMDVTAKDFRTWAGSVLAFRALRGEEVPGRPSAERRAVKRAIEQVAERLGNTVSIARSAYVDPQVVDAWREGEVARMRIGSGHDPSSMGPPTPDEEAALLRLLERRRSVGP